VQVPLLYANHTIGQAILQTLHSKVHNTHNSKDFQMHNPTKAWRSQEVSYTPNRQVRRGIPSFPDLCEGKFQEEPFCLRSAYTNATGFAMSH
jgi:hypothetical protein